MTAKRKITALLVCLALLVSSVALTISVSAANAFTLVGKASEETVEPGDTFTVNVDLKNNTGLAAIEVAFGYDKAALKLEKVENKINSFAFTPGLSNIWDASEDFIGDATLCTATFTVLKTAAAGDYEIKIICKSAAGSDADGNLVEVTPETTTPAEVTVKLPPVAVKSVKLDKTSASMFVGETLKLNATVSPDNATNKDVTWKSSNASVISVDKDGNVKALKAGEATITATADGKSASCKITATVKPCDHASKTKIDAADSTCTKKGNDEYYKCNDCSKLFDKDGKEISDIPFRALAPHKGGTATCTAKAVCSVCGNPYGDLLPHDYSADAPRKEALKTPGTCMSEAVYYYSCGRCFVVEKNDAHTFLGDKDPGNHAGGTELKNEKKATEESEGYSGDVYCKGCGEKLQDGTVTAKLEHKPELVEAKKSTCSEKGHSEYYHCEGCGKNYADEKGETEITDLTALELPLDPENHSGETEVKNAVAATKDKEGYTGDTYCKGCSALLKKGEVTEKLKGEEDGGDKTPGDGDKKPGTPDSVPETGDTVSVALFAVLAVLSSGVLVFSVTHERKRRKRAM